MIKKEAQTKTETVDVIKDIVCNMCGKTCIGEIGNFCGANIRISGGYDSPKIPDGMSYEFDLCEHCLTDIMSKLTIPAKEESDIAI